METTEHTNYVYRRLPGQGESAADHVVDLAPRNGDMLELGAGPGSITSRLKSEANCRVTAVELMEGFLPHLRPHAERVVQTDLNSREWLDEVGSAERFDAIVAADVLEHLEQPAALLSTARQLLRKGGSVIISLPHVGHCVIHACLMDEDFEYRDWGLLDRTHIRFFGLKNMQKLVEEAGLKVVDVRFVKRMPEDTEYAERWRGAPDDLKAAVLRSPHAHVYQCVIRAVPIDDPRQGLNIMGQVAGTPRVTGLMRLARSLKRWLPAGVYSLMKRLYSGLHSK